MVSRERTYAVPGVLLLLLALAGFSCISAEAAQQRRKSVPAEIRPPVVSLESSAEVVTLCPTDAVLASRAPEVQLRANASDPNGLPLRYTWTSSSGRIVGGGANPTWDLSGLPPGIYTANVEVDNGGGAGCVAFASTKVIINECPPPRPFCPNVAIYCPDVVNLGSPVTFRADISGGTPNVTPTYRWTVSTGTITSGQGTPSITVDTAGLGGQAIRASVEVLGYELNCAATCTAQVPAPVNPRRFDEYGNVRFNDEKARLDNFVLQLQNEPTSLGYIIAYADRRGREDEGRLRAGRARNYLVNERGIDPSRIVTLDGGYQEALTIELWIVPSGATPPKPRPSLDRMPTIRENTRRRRP